MRIMIYTLSTCSHCKAAKRFLNIMVSITITLISIC
jgi:glutaredoxin